MAKLFACVLLACVAAQLAAQPKRADRSTVTGIEPGKESAFVNSGWRDQEQLLSEVAGIRAAVLERETGLKFEPGRNPRISLEWALGAHGIESDAVYSPEAQTIYVSIRIFYELAARHVSSSNVLSAESAARDDELGELLDHELGHELMDQVSRRNGLGPWFTQERFNQSSPAEMLGFDIVSEGAAVYFQRSSFPRSDNGIGLQDFPSTSDERGFYTYRTIAYDGGYWLVGEVLWRYGEQGLIWLMQHPFVAGDNMRSAAMAYRERALRELQDASHKKSRSRSPG